MLIYSILGTIGPLRFERTETLTMKVTEIEKVICTCLVIDNKRVKELLAFLLKAKYEE